MTSLKSIALCLLTGCLPKVEAKVEEPKEPNGYLVKCWSAGFDSWGQVTTYWSKEGIYKTNNNTVQFKDNEDENVIMFRMSCSQVRAYN